MLKMCIISITRFSMRPYSCDDEEKGKSDTVFQNWVKDFASDVAVSISDVQNVCFFIVDANRQAKRRQCGTRGGGCIEMPSLAKLSCINHSSMDHPDEKSGTWGDIKIEHYVRR